jgi:hypothetical protein
VSEFSESYHLASVDTQDAVSLLTTAGLHGFVFPPENGWVTLVVDGEYGQVDDRLSAANTGTLLHYVNAADHAWAFDLFQGSTIVCRYECEWEWDVKLVADEVDTDLVVRLARERGSELTPDALHALLHPGGINDVIGAGDEGGLADRFASLLRLPYFSWVSMAYIDDDVRQEVPLIEVP